jgi:transposase
MRRLPLDPAGGVSAEAVFDNTLAGHDALAAWTATNAVDPRSGLEPSGGVGHAVGAQLQRHGLEVMLGPSRLSAREARRDTRRGKI